MSSSWRHSSVLLGPFVLVLTACLLTPISGTSLKISEGDERITFLEAPGEYNKLVVIEEQRFLIWTQRHNKGQECRVRHGNGELEIRKHVLYTQDVFYEYLSRAEFQQRMALHFASTEETRSLDFSSVEALFSACQGYSSKSSPAHAAGRVRRSAAAAASDFLILPTTKWCGKGNVASDQQDTGESLEADQCCRKHDHCSQTILAYGSLLGYRNPYPYTLSHCNCDDEFYMCLQNANRRVANQVGRLFFNMLKVKCFLITKQRRCVEWYWSGLFCKRFDVVDTVAVYNAQKWA